MLLERTSGVIRSRYRLRCLLKLTTLKTTRWFGRHPKHEKKNQLRYWSARVSGRREISYSIPSFRGFTCCRFPLS